MNDIGIRNAMIAKKIDIHTEKVDSNRPSFGTLCIFSTILKCILCIITGIVKREPLSRKV